MWAGLHPVRRGPPSCPKSFADAARRVNVCVGGGVTVLVAVVLALSFAAEHEVSNTTIIETQNDDKSNS